MGAGLWRGAGPGQGRSLRAGAELTSPASTRLPRQRLWPSLRAGARLQFLNLLLWVGGEWGGRDAFPRDWGRGDAAWRARQPLRSGPLPRLVPPPAAAKTWRDPDLAEVPREPALLPTLPPTVCPTRSLNGVEGVRGTWAQGRQGFAPSWAPRRCQGGGGMLRP